MKDIKNGLRKEKGEHMVKMYEKIAAILLIAFFAWILVSWVDVMMHNSPSSGDYQYHSWNIFTTVFEK